MVDMNCKKGETSAFGDIDRFKYSHSLFQTASRRSKTS